MPGITRATSTMIFANILLAALLTAAPATPTGNEAKTKKLMRKDHADSGEAVALQVKARGATVAQHQRLHSEPHAEAKDAVVHSAGVKQKLKGNSQPAGDGDDNEDDEEEEDEDEEDEDEDEDDDGEDDDGEDDDEEDEDEEDEVEETKEGKASEQKENEDEEEKHAMEGAEGDTDGVVAKCSNADGHDGRDDCVGYDKNTGYTQGCGLDQGEDWEAQCGYGVEGENVPDECVLKSKLAPGTHEASLPDCSQPSNANWRRGKVFCLGGGLYVQCVNGTNLSAHLSSAITDHDAAVHEEAKENADQGVQSNHETDLDPETQMDMDMANLPITEQDINHPTDVEINQFDGMKEDQSIPYTPDPDKDEVCKPVADIEVTDPETGQEYTLSYFGGSKHSAQGKRCLHSKTIHASDDLGHENFDFGRLEMCATYSARLVQTSCAGGAFWMTKDYACFCGVATNCESEDQHEVVEEDDACLYQLDALEMVQGAPPTLARFQAEANHLQDIEDQIEDKFMNNPLAPGEMTAEAEEAKDAAAEEEKEEDVPAK